MRTIDADSTRPDDLDRLEPETAGGARRRRPPLALVAATVIGLLAALGPPLVTAASRDRTTPVDAPASPAPATTGHLLDVDAGGAIVGDEATGVIRGVRASGAPVWVDDRAGADGASVTCAGRCPQAVVSAGPASRISGPEQDPPPRTLGLAPAIDDRPDTGDGTVIDDETVTGVLTRALGDARSRHRRVLALDERAAVLVTAGDDGRAWLETWADGSRTGRRSLPTPDAVWLPTSDRSVATVVADTTDPRRFEVHVLHREPGGWRVGDEPLVSTIPFGCPGGRGRVIRADPRPVLVRPDGAEVVIARLRSGSECAFAERGAIVSQLSAAPTGATARVVIVDDAGTVRWQADHDRETRIHADAHRDRFVIVSGGTAVERAGDGTVVRTVTDADDARYDEESRLVLLQRDGSVRWLPPSP